MGCLGAMKDVTPLSQTSLLSSKVSASVLTRDDFDYKFPEHLVAQSPLPNRDDARLLVRHHSGDLYHKSVQDLTTEIPSDSLVIFNNTKVIPSRIFGTLRTGGRIELLLLEQVRNACWKAVGRPMRKLKVGTEIHFHDGTIAEVASVMDGSIEVNFIGHSSDVGIIPWLDKNGVMPTPPYIKRDTGDKMERGGTGGDRTQMELDHVRYQTIYARHIGSVAAPTAGLHFSESLLADIRSKGIEFANVCLHVGLGTFLPVKTNNIASHEMHWERFSVPQNTMSKILEYKKAGAPIVVVGTTSFRALESLAMKANADPAQLKDLAESDQRTDLFIYPKMRGDRYHSYFANGLITNFHQPKSTLIMLVSALIGYQECQDLYREAIKENYRLFSYGDTSLLWL